MVNEKVAVADNRKDVVPFLLEFAIFIAIDDFLNPLQGRGSDGRPRGIFKIGSGKSRKGKQILEAE